MRSLAVIMPLFVLGLAAPAARGDDGEPPLLAVELHVGGALSGAIDQAWRPPPMSVSVTVAGALVAEPWTTFYGEVGAYTLRGTDLSFAGGVRVHPAGPLRVGGGAAGIVWPSTAIGPRATIGGCFGRTLTHLCADLEATVYVVGKAVPEGDVAADVRVVLGVGFNLL
jgi:hypothetical protein